MPQRKKMQDKFQEETLEETKILGFTVPVGPIAFSQAVPRSDGETTEGNRCASYTQQGFYSPSMAELLGLKGSNNLTVSYLGEALGREPQE